MGFTKETTLGEVMAAAKFKPGDLVVHRTQVGDKHAVFCVLHAYVAFNAGAFDAHIGYALRAAGPGGVPDSVAFHVEIFKEFELELRADYVATREAMRDIARETRDLARETAAILKGMPADDPQAVGLRDIVEKLEADGSPMT